ncbi:MAG: DEAD/DEAH box helicase [Balneolales bacterium]|nr:DEAD/DEAH box helicase [Balneolales bacterium]
MTFKEFNLEESLQSGLQDIGFEEPTPIQAKSIPIALEGKDILGAAQTGTGKTGAFVIPILQKILTNPSEGTKALILSPTRELAQQIDEQIFALGYHTGLHSSTIIGGEDFAKQAEAIRAGVDIIVATPGRLIDQMKVLDIDFSGIQFLILDEADRMLDMGFLPDVNHIIDKLPKDRQTLMFSATMPREIQKLSKEIMNKPEFVKIEVSKAANSVEQRAYTIDGREKLKLTQRLLDDVEWSSCIIFTATKRGTDQLERLLVKKGIKVGSIHGDRDQEDRTRALNAFKNGEVPIIIATDVLARGIDIADVSLIINYDVPQAVEDYIHRIGRTGRYDKTGIAITLVNKKDTKLFKAIEAKVRKDLTVIDGDALIQSPSGHKEKPQKKEQKAKKPSPQNKRQQSKKITPDWSDAKGIKATRKDDGKLSFELLGKPDQKKQEKPKKKEVKVQKQEKKPQNKKKEASKRDRNVNKKKNNKQKQKQKANISEVELKTINKASERNKKSRKPAKGIWGLIKSMFPKF